MTRRVDFFFFFFFTIKQWIVTQTRHMIEMDVFLYLIYLIRIQQNTEAELFRRC